nr:ribonuclease H-like domain-containing protein [Tanacetum cinerariifolium]
MDSLSPRVVSAAKLPILNPNEFDLWKMRTEQYFLIIDYSLWEVILNGDSLVPTRVIDGVLQPVAPTTAEQRLAQKNELKARGTLFMALPDKHQLKFNSYKDAKTLMEAIEKRFGGNTETKKIQKTLLKQQFENFTGTATQNLAFVSSSHTDSTTDSVSVAASVFAVCAKLPISSLPNVDSLSNAIDDDDLEEMDLRWQMAMLTMRARRNGHFARECRSLKDSRRSGAAEPQKRTVPVETSTSNALVSQCDGKGSYDWSYQVEEEPANYALMAFSSSSSSSDNEVPSCSKACSKAYAQLHTQYNKLIDDFRKYQFDVILYQTSLEFVEARLLVYKQNKSVFEENIKLVNIEVQLRDTALVTLRQTLEKIEHERDGLKLKFQPSGGYHAVPLPYTGIFMPPKLDLVFNTSPIAVKTDHLAFNVQLSPTKPDQDLSHTTRPTAAIIEDRVSDSEDESETKDPHPKSAGSGKRKNMKASFVCKSVDHLIKDCDYHAKKMAHPTLRNYTHRGNHKQYAPLTHTTPQKHMVPTAVLTHSKPVFNTVVRPDSATMPKINVTRPRYAHQVVIRSKSPIKRYITRSPSPKPSNLLPKVIAVKAPVVSVAQVILNGESPVPTRVVEGVLQPVAPTTAEQRLARKNKLKARGTLLMALPNKHQLKINSHKDAKTLMEATEKRFRGNTETKKVQKTLLKQQFKLLVPVLKTHTLIWRNKADLEEQSLDDLFNSLKIYETKVKQSSSTGTASQNLAFVSSSHTNSTTDSVSVAASIFYACAKLHVSSLPNVDSLSNADSRRTGAVEPQRRTVLVETSTSNALVSRVDGTGSYDWSYQAEEEPANYALMAFSSSSSSSDTE